MVPAHRIREHRWAVSSGGSQAGQQTWNASSTETTYSVRAIAPARVRCGACAAGGHTSCTHGGDSNFVIPPIWTNGGRPPAPPHGLLRRFLPRAQQISAPKMKLGERHQRRPEWPLIGGWLRVEAKLGCDEAWTVTNGMATIGLCSGSQASQRARAGCGTTPATNTRRNWQQLACRSQERDSVFPGDSRQQAAGAPSVTADYPLTVAGGRYYDTAATSTKFTVQLVSHQLL